MNNTTPATYKHNHGVVEHNDVMLALTLLKQGKTIDEVVAHFEGTGKEEDHAIMIVGYASQMKHKIKKPQPTGIVSQKTKNNGLFSIISGSLLLTTGVILTAMDLGYIFYGAIVVGMLQIVRGIIAFSNNR